ncbi:hypothetical protein TUMEXPCC7403_15895 [Tumidithrix helvetica PCC 7403]|uniref:response regulator n=1 Tax=Tumidithrix helvetica TaxID=3457545 RepID=UPI003CA4FB96
MPNSPPRGISQDGRSTSFFQALPSPTTILIVEDSEIDRTTYIRYLQSNAEQSYRIITAETLEAGLELWRSQHPDVVLVDMSLPDGDGLEFLTEIGTDKADEKLPAIVLTGQGDERTAVQAMKLGAADYLIKSDITAILKPKAIARFWRKMDRRRSL